MFLATWGHHETSWGIKKMILLYITNVNKQYNILLKGPYVYMCWYEWLKLTKSNRPGRSLAAPLAAKTRLQWLPCIPMGHKSCWKTVRVWWEPSCEILLLNKKVCFHRNRSVILSDTYFNNLSQWVAETKPFSGLTLQPLQPCCANVLVCMNHLHTKTCKHRARV